MMIINIMIWVWIFKVKQKLKYDANMPKKNVVVFSTYFLKNTKNMQKKIFL